MASSTPTSSTKTKLLHAATHATHIMGRHVLDESTGAILVDWPGVRLDFEGITNTSFVKVRMNGKWSVFGYRVIVEEEEEEAEDAAAKNDSSVLVTGVSAQDYSLGVMETSTTTTEPTCRHDLDPTKKYTVSIWKRDDPMNHGATIYGLVVDQNGSATSKKDQKQAALQQDGLPNEKKNRRRRRRLIEFVGDSDTVGFGNVGSKTSVWYYTLIQQGILTALNDTKIRTSTDVTQSWAHVVADAFQANYHMIAYGGAGVKYSMVLKDNMVDDLYTRMLGSNSRTKVKPQHKDKDDTKQQPPQDVASLLGPSPNVVVVYMGQNDQQALKERLRLKEQTLQDAFVQLLKKIRQFRPLPIPIIVVVPDLEAKLSCQKRNGDNDKMAKLQNKVWKQAVELQVADESSTTGDDPSRRYVHVVENKHEPQITLGSKEDYGMCLHWNASSHQKWANGLIPKLAQILHWKPQES